MRLHTYTLHALGIHEALQSAMDKGHVADHLCMDLTPHRSRSHARAFEVKLYTLDKEPGDKRRFTNTGTHGAGCEYAATYDEWGWFITELYTVDPTMKFGQYRDATHFHAFTRNAYRLPAEET